MSALIRKLLRSERRSRGARVGIAFGADRFALALVHRRAGEKPAIDHCAVHPAAVGAGAALKRMLETCNAGRAAVCAVLDREDYQVAQVEAPDVLPAELRAAIRWRLRDAISFRVEDATVDVFEIPQPVRGGQGRMLFAVAARTGAIERIVTAIQPVAKGFDAIDIPELCLRNVSTLLPHDAKGVAVLALHERYAHLITTRQGVMYLTRRIDITPRFQPHAAERAELDAASLALELQRSLDYYETHYDQTPITDLVIAPGDDRSQRLAAALEDETSLQISVLDVRELFELRTSDELICDSLSLMALGAALRCDSAES